MTEFSKRELEVLDPIFERIESEQSYQQKNVIICGSLRIACDKQRTSIVEYLAFKFGQKHKAKQPEKLPQEAEQTVFHCLYCGTELTGRKTKWCNDTHRMKYANEQLNN